MANHAHAESSLCANGLARSTKPSWQSLAGRRSRSSLGEAIVFDAGSTVAALAHELRSRTNLTVTTTSLIVLNELSRAENLTVNSLGGTLRPFSQGFVGPITEAALDTMSFDRAFLGADSVDAELGICEADPHQTRLKQLLARRSRARLRPGPRTEARPSTFPCLGPAPQPVDAHHQRRRADDTALCHQRHHDCPGLVGSAAVVLAGDGHHGAGSATLPRRVCRAQAGVGAATKPPGG